MRSVCAKGNMGYNCRPRYEFPACALEIYRLYMKIYFPVEYFYSNQKSYTLFCFKHLIDFQLFIRSLNIFCFVSLCLVFFTSFVCPFKKQSFVEDLIPALETIKFDERFFVVLLLSYRRTRLKLHMLPHT